MDNPADLLNAAIEELVRARYELPALSTLDRLTAHLRTQVNDHSFQMVAARLKEEASAPLHTLFAQSWEGASLHQACANWVSTARNTVSTWRSRNLDT
jgi:hypothetical protein